MAGLLAERLQALELEIVGTSAILEHATSHQLPRLFLLETEYGLTMKRAEAGWVRGLLRELADGTFVNLELWREVHETGNSRPRCGTRTGPSPTGPSSTSAATTGRGP